MYARASSMSGDPARVDEATKMLESELYAQMEQMDGFRGVVALAQRDSGHTLVVTFWDSEGAMTASEERANQMRGAAATEIGATGAPEIDRYEVIFYRTPGK
jgi:heme-degrading monooxygenase HmoA